MGAWLPFGCSNLHMGAWLGGCRALDLHFWGCGLGWMGFDLHFWGRGFDSGVSLWEGAGLKRGGRGLNTPYPPFRKVGVA